MQSLPHQYAIVATGGAEGDVALSGDGLPALASAPPVEFDGPGGRWSPETLLLAAKADCYVLTFRAIALASKVPWLSLRCEVTGTLDRVDHATQFTGFVVRASLKLPAGANEAQALRMLERSERSCVIANSLKAASRLETTVEIDA